MGRTMNRHERRADEARLRRAIRCRAAIRKLAVRQTRDGRQVDTVDRDGLREVCRRFGLRFNVALGIALDVVAS